MLRRLSREGVLVDKGKFLDAMIALAGDLTFAEAFARTAARSEWPSWWRHSGPPRAPQAASEGLGLLYALGRRGVAPQTTARSDGSPARGRPGRRFRRVGPSRHGAPRQPLDVDAVARLDAAAQPHHHAVGAGALGRAVLVRRAGRDARRRAARQVRRRRHRAVRVGGGHVPRRLDAERHTAARAGVAVPRDSLCGLAVQHGQSGRLGKGMSGHKKGHVGPPRSPQTAFEGSRLLYALGRRGLAPQTTAGSDGSSARGRPS